MSEAANPQDTPKKKGGAGRLLLACALGLLVAAAAAGGAWYALKAEPAQAGAAPAKKKEQKKPLFTTLETFTVNLQDPRGERFAQIGITLQFEDPSLESTLKERLPAVRNAILLLISAKQIEELLTLEGKQKLAEEIRVRSALAIGLELPQPGTKNAAENPIRAVLFSQFIVQ